MGDPGRVALARMLLARLRLKGGDVGPDHEGRTRAFLPDEVDSPEAREALRQYWPELLAIAEEEHQERIRYQQEYHARRMAEDRERLKARRRTTTDRGPAGERGVVREGEAASA